MKKSESTALKTEHEETKGTVVLLTSVTDVKAGEAPKGRAVPKTESEQKAAPIIEGTPPTKPEGDSGEKVKPRRGRKPKKEPAPIIEGTPPQKPEGDSGEKVKPKRGRKPKQESAPIIEAAPPTEPEGDSEEKVKPRRGRKPKQESAPIIGATPPTEPEGDSEEKVKPKAGRKAKKESAPIIEATPSTKAMADSKTEDKAPPEKAGEIPKAEPEPEPPKSEPLLTHPATVPGPPAVTPPVMAEKPPVSVVESPLKLMKQEFNRRSSRIREEMGNIQNSFVVIGFQLHWIKTNNMYRVLNYKNINEYAEKEYNIKKSTCNNLISIIENFAERDENGEVIESITECYRNYSSTQLLAMIGMPEELQEQVTPDMSVRAIQRLRKGEPEKPPVDAQKATITTVKEPEKDIPSKPDTAGSAVSSPKSGADPSAEKPVSPPPEIRAETPPEESTEESEKDIPSESVTAGSAASTPKSGADPSTEKPVSSAPEIRAETPPEEGTKEPEKTVVEEKPADEEKDTANPNPVPQPENPAKPPERADEPGEGTVNLAEVDSYDAYKDMQEKIDTLIKHAFSGDGPVRVKIVCVRG